MKAIQEKGQHIEPEAVLCAIQIERIVRYKAACDLPREHHENVADDGTLTLSATERNSVLGSSLATNDWIPAIVN
mgnify:CR=1 FL=1